MGETRNAPPPDFFSQSIKQLSGQLQLFLGRERLIEGLHVLIVHIVALGRLIHASDPVQIPGDQLPAQEEGIVRALRQIVIADTKFPGIVKSAVAVDVNFVFIVCYVAFFSYYLA